MSVQIWKIEMSFSGFLLLAAMPGSRYLFRSCDICLCVSDEAGLIFILLVSTQFFRLYKLPAQNLTLQGIAQKRAFFSREYHIARSPRCCPACDLGRSPGRTYDAPVYGDSLPSTAWRPSLPDIASVRYRWKTRHPR